MKMPTAVVLWMFLCALFAAMGLVHVLYGAGYLGP
jgi:hypothetical protein